MPVHLKIRWWHAKDAPLTSRRLAVAPSAAGAFILLRGALLLAGFITNTNGGKAAHLPVIFPVLAAPLGGHILVESRATILDSNLPRRNGQAGYTSSSFEGLSYLQMDYLANRHLTVIAGEFLTPFGTYNERLAPIWIGNFQSTPLIFPLGARGTGSSVRCIADL